MRTPDANAARRSFRWASPMSASASAPYEGKRQNDEERDKEADHDAE